MSAYNARPGSTGDLALRHLAAHGPTREIALASAIDKEAHELGALLAWPIKQGAIRKEVVGDEWVYSLGDGMPMVVTEVKVPQFLPPQVVRELSKKAQRAVANGVSVEDAVNSGPIARLPLLDRVLIHEAEQESGVRVQACRGADREMAMSSAGIEMIVKAAAALAASSPVEKPEAQPTGLRGKNAALWLTGELAFEATDGTVIVFDHELAKRLAVFLLPIFEAQP
jgi:hypothetical protein